MVFDDLPNAKKRIDLSNHALEMGSGNPDTTTSLITTLLTYSNTWTLNNIVILAQNIIQKRSINSEICINETTFNPNCEFSDVTNTVLVGFFKIQFKFFKIQFK